MCLSGLGKNSFSMSMDTLFSLQEHAYRLSKVIAQFSEQKNDSKNKWHLASEWLHLGLSIRAINIVTE